MAFLKLVARYTVIPPQRIQGEYLTRETNKPVINVLCGNHLDGWMFTVVKGAWNFSFISNWALTMDCHALYYLHPVIVT